ncbi:DUF4190 domain-containing protein [Glaciihabitans sp. dw_435]|uniref:DUF4190 domain-containing protein n=1 Tax=Glaciihabitans sp. dw_435 TaxID=2720081 RepID=UPI002106E14C|nr:DUF4190 domain-containing protein [Glaciihabitans sp. dw_435]
MTDERPPAIPQPYELPPEQKYAPPPYGQSHEQQYAPPPYGQPYGQPYGTLPYGVAPYRPTNTLAIISLITAFFVQPAAIVTGHIALSQIKRTGEAGRGLAIAGLVVGYGTIALAILWIASVIIIVVTNATSPGTTSL